MSDIIINLCVDSPAQTRTPGANRKRRNKRSRKKMQYSERARFGEGKNKYNHRTGQSRQAPPPPRHNGAIRNHPAPPASTETHSPPSSIASTSHCSSRPSTSAHSPPSSTVTVNAGGTTHCSSSSNSHTQTPTGIPTKYLAIDCEMVGSGPKGSINQLARCSIVSYEGDVVYDKFIKPSMPVTDYRTRWSGIRRSDLVNATPYAEARKEILRLLMGKVVIGHAIHNDFKVLGYSHPGSQTRDTSRIPLLNQKAGFPANECASLKRLTKAIFNREIQTGRKGHSSVEDARATMELYKVVEQEWERQLASKPQAHKTDKHGIN
ncbi:Interferon-stimulated 20 kDa exonuclease-like 2 [Larimichthys crocea]|uniref:Interferon-stimulated 20 kDa exonuclease-like 2 n=1 Tax=Larimichthys crocea TaxID=215358 RepID=A0A6G0ID83_LARCR|nr:Interferon-stimulated 20 kDa exonuclease-like 2 [Larimichthys crocea]